MHLVHGSGTINLEDEDTYKSFNEELVARSVKTQKQLLRKAVSILKRGGELIYSTCSVLKEENEKNIEELLKNSNLQIIPIDLEMFKGIPLLPTTIEGTICIKPSKLYEGFFIAKIKRS